MSDSMNLLVRADVGPTVGTGHVMRMFALGQAWKKQGGKVAFACRELPKSLIGRIQSEDFDVYKLNNTACDLADATETSELVAQLKPAWIALDGYGFGDQYQSILSECGAKILVFDDYQHANHFDADLVVNQNAYANRTDYQNILHGPSQTTVLTGLNFALLRSEFQSHLIETKPTVKQARRILVTFGGADADNWTLRTLKELSNLNQNNLIVDCVLGACFAHTREIELFKKEADFSLRIHLNVDHMSALMGRVDMAISAGGSTCYELARCGVPTVVASIADNQVPVARVLSELNVMVSIDEDSPNSSDTIERRSKRLGQAIKKLVGDFELRKSMSELGTQLIDGKGGMRISQKMIESQFCFRAVQESDAKRLWLWRNDPEVRSVSFNQSAIPLESHKQWLGKKINDSNTKLLICETKAGEPVGQIRFDLATCGTKAVISITVDQAMRGKGFGKMLIKQTCAQLFQDTAVESILAQIKSGNTASERAFRGAGFEAIEPEIQDGKIALQFLLNRSSMTELPQRTPAKKSA